MDLKKWSTTEKDKSKINQSSGYDVYRRRAVLCIAVAMTSIDVMHVSNLNVRGI
jgi:hypothetical protein